MPSPKQYENSAARQKAFRDRQKTAREEAIAKGAPKAAAVPTMPSAARWKALISQARAALDTAASEMQAYYDERSETWQESNKAEALQERTDALQGIVDELDQLL